MCCLAVSQEPQQVRSIETQTPNLVTPTWATFAFRPGKETKYYIRLSTLWPGRFAHSKSLDASLCAYRFPPLRRVFSVRPGAASRRARRPAARRLSRWLGRNGETSGVADGAMVFVRTRHFRSNQWSGDPGCVRVCFFGSLQDYK